KTPNIDKFLNEVRTLDIKQSTIKADKNNLDLKFTGLPEHLYGKDIQICDLRHYSQFTSDYKGTLDKLKVSALNEFKNLSEPKRLSNLKAVKTLAEKITKSWDCYLSIKDEKGSNLLSAINNRLTDFFIIPNKPTTGSIYNNFTTDLHNAILFKKMAISDFIKETEPLTVEVGADSPAVDKYKDNLWFKFGLLLATGRMNEYLSPNKTVLKSNYSAPKIAKELGNESFEKYILATINNYSLNNSNANKNIFNSRDKMLKIINHCEINNLAIDPYFKECLPTE
ncbi:MAG: hypothetical protein RQ875_14750, partial [Vicingaceae bacterium]|nr:hypothetical protein [Vicingaceae bacterium]